MQSIIKYFKRIIIAIIILLAMVAGGLFIIGYFYADKTEQFIVGEINKSLLIEISVEDIELSLFRNFPNASLNFTNLKTKESLTSNTSPLLNAQKVSLLFNIYDIFSGNYKIDKIVLQDAFLNIIVHEDGSTNYKVFQTDKIKKNVSVNIDLRQLILRNVEVSYIHYHYDQEYLIGVKKGELQGIFTPNDLFVKIWGEIYSNHIRSGKNTFLKDRQLITGMEIKIDKNKQEYSINNGWLETAGLFFNIKGSVNTNMEKRTLDLEIKANKSPLQSFLQMVPDVYLEPVKNYRLKGDLDFNSKITGEFSRNKLPLINFNFNLKNGIIEDKKTGLEFQQVSFSGYFQNGKSKTKESFSIHLVDFEAQLYSSKINGSLDIQNFEKPVITASIKSKADLLDIRRIFHLDQLHSATGMIEIDMQFKNTLKSFRQFTVFDFISSNTTGFLKISDVDLQFKNNTIKYSQMNGSFTFSNKDLIVNQLYGKFEDSDFSMKGTFINMLAFIFIPDETIKIKADFASENLTLDHLLKSPGEKNGKIYHLAFSKNIDFDLNLDINKFSFRNFNASHLKGKVLLNNQILNLQHATLQSMEGASTISGLIDGTVPDRFLIKFDASLTDVDIHQLFYQLGEFGQQTITSENIRGNVNAQIYYQSYISPSLKIYPESVYTVGDIIIKEGELIDFKPLYKLSKFLKNKDLEHIHFSTLQNQIKIKDQVITIPDMDVASNTLDLKISGTHSFQNEVDYHIQILLSELISNSARSEEPIEGIFTEDDGLGRTTVFLRMTGNGNNPDIKYDTKEVGKKIASDLKKEKMVMKDVLQKEFNWFSKEENGSVVDESNIDHVKDNHRKFIIEWEEDEIKDSIYSRQHDSPEKEIHQNKKNFIIQWDEENDTIK